MHGSSSLEEARKSIRLIFSSDSHHDSDTSCKCGNLLLNQFESNIQRQLAVFFLNKMTRLKIVKREIGFEEEDEYDEYDDDGEGNGSSFRSF